MLYQKKVEIILRKIRKSATRQFLEDAIFRRLLFRLLKKNRIFANALSNQIIWIFDIIRLNTNY